MKNSLQLAEPRKEIIKLPTKKTGKKLSVILIPKEQIQEEISVTALDTEEKAVSVPMSESKVSQLEIKEKIAENIVTTLLNTPGVHFIGKGGYTVTPSIRGLARRRYEPVCPVQRGRSLATS